MNRRLAVALSVAATVGITGGIGTALSLGGRDGTPPVAEPVKAAAPLWATAVELHDGNVVVPLEGVDFVTGIERVGDSWILQDVPNGAAASPRVLRVDPDGTVTPLADVHGHGDIDASGTHHVGLSADDESYVVTDLRTGKRTRVPPPPDPGPPEGTALFDGEDVITGWSPVGTTYYRSALDGTGLRIVGRDPVDAQFAPDRERYVGVRTGLGDQCLFGGAAEEEATLWKQCPGALPSAPAYAPDSTRFVAYASGEGGGGTGRAVVRDATTGKAVADFDLPGDVTLDMTMVSADAVAVLTITGPTGAETTTVYTCDLSGRCDRSGTASGIGVLGGSP